MVTPVFVALTAEGLATARRAAQAIGGEVHVLSFSHREKVPAKRADEGLSRIRTAQETDRRTPSPVAFGDTLSPRERVSAESSGHEIVFAETAAHLRALFAAGRPIVGVCAAGILIRILAPLLADKHDEPPVLALSEDGVSIVPLIGGHRGANELARALAEALGGHAAITTAGDNRFGVALDAPPAGWTLANPQHAKPVMAALLAGAGARLEGDADWLRRSRIPFAADGEVRLVATTRAIEGDARTLVYHPPCLAVGIGCERGADPAEAVALVEQALDGAGLARESIALIASIDLKADEGAVLEAAAHFGVPARFFSAATLEAETPRLRNPSITVFREVGCHGVSEGAALAAAGGNARLIVAKVKSARVTCAVAEASDVIDGVSVGRARGRLAIVGIGPGAADWLTPEARRLLETSDAAIGYSLYLDLVAPLIAGAERFDSALGSEEARARQALALAAEGRAVALVSSGDAGIYAMASLVFEYLDHGRQENGVDASWSAIGGPLSHREKVVAERPDEGLRPEEVERVDDRRILSPVASGDTLSLWERESSEAAARVEIVVAPGISAMQAAAARGGAPLGHDFCAISLSDLLTPWETIEARIRAAAAGDFVIAFYNPVSRRRTTQLAAAKRILLQHRPPDTPVLLARNLGREGETTRFVTLSELNAETVDMLTLVLVGSSATRQINLGGRAWIYTPRGYERKRDADAAE